MPRAQREVRAAQAAGERLTQMRARRRVRPGGRRGSAGPRHRTPPPSPGSVLLPPQPLVVGGRAALPAHQAARRYLAPVTYIKQPAVEPQLRTAPALPPRVGYRPGSRWRPAPAARTRILTRAMSVNGPSPSHRGRSLPMSAAESAESSSAARLDTWLRIRLKSQHGLKKRIRG